MEWYHVCWSRLTAKRVEPVVSISWASCKYTHSMKIYVRLFTLLHVFSHCLLSFICSYLGLWFLYLKLIIDCLNKLIWCWQTRAMVPFDMLGMVFRLDAWALSVIATATWLAGWVAGWVSVALRYCMKTAKPIWTLFRPSESPIILVFCDPCADTKFQGEPLQRGR